MGIGCKNTIVRPYLLAMYSRLLSGGSTIFSKTSSEYFKTYGESVGWSPVFALDHALEKGNTGKFGLIWKIFLLILLMGLSLPSHVYAQNAGDLDLTFNADQLHFGDGADNVIFATAIQTDGKILIGGGFDNYNGVSINGIARLNTDGTLDASFNPGSGPAGDIKCIAIQPDGKILLGGDFWRFSDSGRTQIVRLNIDGSVDTTFTPPREGYSFPRIESVIIQSDGKIVIGGKLATLDEIQKNGIARLNADGSLDTSFNRGAGVNGLIETMDFQADGKIVIGGNFTAIDGIPRNRIARLKSNGSLDTTFDPGTGANLEVMSLAVLPDGKIMAAGRFNTYNGSTESQIVRLNPDGSLDASFHAGTGIAGSSIGVASMAIQPDGKIVLGGSFYMFQGINGNQIVRLNTDGNLDPTFEVGIDVRSSRIESVALQSDGKIVVGGWFSSFKNAGRGRIARLNGDGSMDNDFNPNTGPNDGIYRLVILKDGKIMIGGRFTSYSGTARNLIARLNADGSLDHSFNPVPIDDHIITNFVIQPDGKLVLLGSYNRILRLNTDGSLDPSFNTGTGTIGSIATLAIQPDGKILIGGSFWEYDGTSITGIARLNPDGSLDPSFHPGEGPQSPVTDQIQFPSINRMVILEEGKIVVAGQFTSFNGTDRNFIARLNADGSLDPSFDPGDGPKINISDTNPHIQNMISQKDGKMMIGGFFSSYNGKARGGIARLNVDGSLDDSFDFNPGMTTSIYNIVSQPDQKLLVTGSLPNQIARFNDDGSFDHSFDPGTGPNNSIHSMALQADGKILIGGYFTGYNGVSRVRIARLHNDIKETECKTEAKAKTEVILLLDENGQATLTPSLADDGSTNTCGPVELDVSRCDFTCADLGEQTVELIVKEQSGNIDRVPFKVKVVDEIKPDITIEQRLFVAVMPSGDTFRMPDFKKMIQASDNCSFSLTQNPKPGTEFRHSEMGYVELEAKDNSGNMAMAKFKFVLIFFKWKMLGKYFREAGEGNEGLVTVPWNTPFESLIHEGLEFEAGSDQETIRIIQWNSGGYDPLTPGYYQVDGHLENSGFEGMDVRLKVPVIVLNKPMAEDIVLTNNILFRNLRPGEIIGSLHTVDPLDTLHSYSMSEHPDIDLENGVLVWKGEGIPPLETKITVNSTDRAGQIISRDIVLSRETPAPNDVLIYPNPAISNPNIHVRLANSSLVTIRIFDVTGRQIYEETRNQDASFSSTLDIKGYSAGLYHVIIQIDQHFISKRLIKQ